MWDLIVSVPDHCLSFYFMKNLQEVMNVADWKLISGDIEMQQH